MKTADLVDDFFRHEYSDLVAVLTQRFSWKNLQEIEDAVQYALLKALEQWTHLETPEHPARWLYRVAHNELLSRLRQNNRQLDLLKNRFVQDRVTTSNLQSYEIDNVQDDLLMTLFACCDETLPQRSQLIFALKILCGFDVREIAIRIFMSEEGVYKRLSRARSYLQKQPPQFDKLSDLRCRNRLRSVHAVLYAIFSEGYFSSHAERVIRIELCNEAIRLVEILGKHPIGNTPETSALVALMHLHFARFEGRTDHEGSLLLLKEQDRSLWNRPQIGLGMRWLERSSQGDVISRYHAEAGLAAEHCMAPSFEETRWDRVIELYDLLDSVAPSALNRINRAIAVAELRGPAVGHAELQKIEIPAWLLNSHIWASVQADFHQRLNNQSEAASYRKLALQLAPSKSIRELLKRRLGEST